MAIQSHLTIGDCTLRPYSAVCANMDGCSQALLKGYLALLYSAHEPNSLLLNSPQQHVYESKHGALDMRC